MAKKGYTPKDHFFKQAKSQGLRARSAFKIDEIAKRLGILKKGARVLDMGAAPGGFLQVIADAVGPAGLVVGVDLAPIRPFTQPWVRTAVLDVLAEDFDGKLKALYDGPLDVVVSDLAPKTTGIRTTDEARSQRLAHKALDVAMARSALGGHFVAKLFMGGDFEEFRAAVKGAYAEVKLVRPEATRGGSMEIYVAGLNRRP
ncbi:MAG: RlmE family RNA methyltransferase [Deltaproteobacteria bacterium]|nr:RlmE family RNA methyltransferase [Deltaproteobacteria bacterium]